MFGSFGEEEEGGEGGEGGLGDPTMRKSDVELPVMEMTEWRGSH